MRWLAADRCALGKSVEHERDLGGAQRMRASAFNRRAAAERVDPNRGRELVGLASAEKGRVEKSAAVGRGHVDGLVRLRFWTDTTIHRCRVRSLSCQHKGANPLQEFVLADVHDSRVVAPRALFWRCEDRSDAQGFRQGCSAVFAEALQGEPPQPFRMALLPGSGGVVARERSEMSKFNARRTLTRRVQHLLGLGEFAGRDRHADRRVRSVEGRGRGRGLKDRHSARARDRRQRDGRRERI